MKRAAVLDDYQGEVLALPYWQRLSGRVHLDHYRDTLADEEALVRRLAPYEILVAIRERTRFPASLLNRLPALELLAITGRNSGHVDVGAATARGVLVAETTGSSVAAIELTLGLIIATVRRIAQEDRALREGRWQTSVGLDLAGKTLGVVGLGRIGSRVAAFGQFLGMRVLAWGPTLTPERAAQGRRDLYVPGAAIGGERRGDAPHPAEPLDPGPDHGPPPGPDETHGLPHQHGAWSAGGRGGVARRPARAVESPGPGSTCSTWSRFPPGIRCSPSTTWC